MSHLKGQTAFVYGSAKGFGTVEEIADATLFLAQNGAVNGSALRAEGGIIRAL